MGAPAPRRPVTPWSVVLQRLRNGCTVAEAAEGLQNCGIYTDSVAAAIRDDHLYAEAYAAGEEARLGRWARMEAVREINCWLAGIGYHPIPYEYH